MTKTHKPQQPAEPADAPDAKPKKSRDSHTDSWRFKEDSESDGLEEETDELLGTVVAGRYLVRELLGRGGMGAVYLAEHQQLQKQVALKILHGYMSGNEEVVARFEREAVAAGRLDHPSIVTATDFGSLGDGSFYLALEYVDGQSLADVLANEGALSHERALSIAFQITDALCKAHEEGIVHRDMKPDNVLLVKTDEGDDFVKVVDFGIAKMRLDEDHQEGLTRAGLVFGTPEYMSPEQAMGNEADARSDVYSVGMLLYEMLAGTSPFHADDVTAMLTAQIKEEPPPLADDVPERLSELVFCLLEKDPDERPESAQLVLGEIAAIVEELHFELPPPRTAAGSRLDGSRKPSQQSHPGLGRSMRRLSMRPVPVGKKKSVPLWIPLAALGVGLAVGVVAMLTNEEVVPTESKKVETSMIDAEAQLIVEATGGDRDAIAELRKLAFAEQKRLDQAGLVPSNPSNRPEGEVEPPKKPALNEAQAQALGKQANRYLVLGRGYAIIKHHTAAIEMYREAVNLDPHLSEDPELLLDVRVAIAARDAVDDGLDFALNALGSHGADIIYDVYLDHLGQAGMTPVVARAMRIAKSDQLLEHATPALKTALRLQKAKYCGEYREILPDAVQFADERSLKTLQALKAVKGCGTFGNKDCFICLRKEEVDLEGAIQAAKTRKSPSFLNTAEETSETEQ